jgi:hypothetical protein
VDSPLLNQVIERGKWGGGCGDEVEQHAAGLLDSEHSDAPAAVDDPAVYRLLAAGRDLLAQGFYPHEIEQYIFRGLSALTPRALIFRAGIGLAESLSKDRASRLADAIGRALRGAPDLVLERQLLLAHLRGQLLQAVFDGAEDLRHDGIAVSPENLRTALTFAIVYARPRSELRPWDVSEADTENMIEMVITDYLDGDIR